MVMTRKQRSQVTLPKVFGNLEVIGNLSMCGFIGEECLETSSRDIEAQT